VQIFADFFGYTAIAIGVALLLGFELPKNFDNPYSAATIQDFWRRWHISLSRWLRDYLYIPLGGNRKGHGRTYFNLMAVMVLGGLWHGAAWTFVVWGAIHGTVLCIERWRTFRWPRLFSEAAWSPARTWVARIITFHIVCFAWIFFRATSFENAFDVLEGLVDSWGQPSPAVTFAVLAAIATGIGVQYLPGRAIGEVLARFSRLPTVAQAAIVALCLMVTSAMGPIGVAPFIYFQF
jgi:D-alanyl-lipoteichoic acid acyltransferase DltB (MBOAT superfamily)